MGARAAPRRRALSRAGVRVVRASTAPAGHVQHLARHWGRVMERWRAATAGAARHPGSKPGAALRTALPPTPTLPQPHPISHLAAGAQAALGAVQGVEELGLDVRRARLGERARPGGRPAGRAPRRGQRRGAGRVAEERRHGRRGTDERLARSGTPTSPPWRSPCAPPPPRAPWSTAGCVTGTRARSGPRAASTAAPHPPPPSPAPRPPRAPRQRGGQVVARQRAGLR